MLYVHIYNIKKIDKIELRLTGVREKYINTYIVEWKEEKKSKLNRQLFHYIIKREGGILIEYFTLYKCCNVFNSRSQVYTYIYVYGNTRGII